MADKPGDYFIGVLDFLGILVPGAVCLTLLIAWFPERAQSVARVVELSGAGHAVAFGVSAYLLGYILHMASAVLDQLTYPLVERGFVGRDIRARVLELLAEDLPSKDVGLVGLYRWAVATIRYICPEWVADLDRMKAQTALFRNMTLVIVLTTIVQMAHRHWLVGMFCAILIAICIRIYTQLRGQNIRTVYEHYIALRALSTRPPFPEAAYRSKGRGAGTE